jgi:hypothetical protein
MMRTGIWLGRVPGALAAGGFILVAIRAGSALRAGTWSVVGELAALELTVLGALAVAATSIAPRGRSALRLDASTPVAGRRAWLERIALLWCMSFAAVLGVFPGLALGLGHPAIWPCAFVALVLVAASVFATESPRRIAWLLCTSYGLAAVTTLTVVRHVI